MKCPLMGDCDLPELKSAAVLMETIDFRPRFAARILDRAATALPETQRSGMSRENKPLFCLPVARKLWLSRVWHSKVTQGAKEGLC